DELLVLGVSAPVRCDNIHSPIAIEISHGHTVPPAAKMGQTKVIGCFCQQTAGVAKNTDRTPFAGENQIAVAVAIQITPHCAIDQTDPAEASRVFDVFDKSAFDLA